MSSRSKNGTHANTPRKQTRTDKVLPAGSADRDPVAAAHAMAGQALAVRMPHNKNNPAEHGEPLAVSVFEGEHLNVEEEDGAASLAEANENGNTGVVAVRHFAARRRLAGGRRYCRQRHRGHQRLRIRDARPPSPTAGDRPASRVSAVLRRCRLAATALHDVDRRSVMR